MSSSAMKNRSGRRAPMLEKLKNANKVVGTRRLVRAIQAGEIAEAYIARDANHRHPAM